MILDVCSPLAALCYPVPASGIPCLLSTISCLPPHPPQHIICCFRTIPFKSVLPPTTPVTISAPVNQDREKSPHKYSKHTHKLLSYPPPSCAPILYCTLLHRTALLHRTRQYHQFGHAQLYLYFTYIVKGADCRGLPSGVVWVAAVPPALICYHTKWFSTSQRQGMALWAAPVGCIKGGASRTEHRGRGHRGRHLGDASFFRHASQAVGRVYSTYARTFHRVYVCRRPVRGHGGARRIVRRLFMSRREQDGGGWLVLAVT